MSVLWTDDRRESRKIKSQRMRGRHQTMSLVFASVERRGSLTLSSRDGNRSIAVDFGYLGNQRYVMGYPTYRSEVLCNARRLTGVFDAAPLDT